MRSGCCWSRSVSVECFESSQAYLKQFNPEKPGCLVLDVRMPGMSGLDLQARLAEERLCPPIIIVTGHGDVPYGSQSGAGRRDEFY